MVDFHKVEYLLGCCSFGKNNFYHFSSFLRRTRYFPYTIFPDALWMSDMNITCMWMQTMLSRLSSSAENPQHGKPIIIYLSPQRRISNGVSLKSTITSNRSHFSQRDLSQLVVIHHLYFLYDSYKVYSEIPIYRIMYSRNIFIFRPRFD